MTAAAVATAPPADPAPDPLEDILAGLATDPAPPAGPATVPASTDDFEDILGEIAAAADEVQITGDAAQRPGRLTSLAGLAPLTAIPRRTWIALAGGLAVLGLSNALSYHAGKRAGLHAVPAPPATPAPVPEKPLPQGLDRYVGLPLDARVDGQTIFNNHEIAAAVVALDGGMELHRDIGEAARRWTAPASITRKGDLLRVHACAAQACGRDAITLIYDAHAKQALICMTTPYGNGGSVSYLFGPKLYREVAACRP